MKVRFLSLLFVATTTLLAASPDPSIGTWKLDPARSHFEGETNTFSKSANGKEHFSDGSAVNADFAFDGKDYPLISDRTMAWTPAGNNAWDVVFHGNGKELGRSHYSISADGKTLTIHETGTRPDGSSVDDTETYTRMSGSGGLEGKWKSTKVNMSTPETYVIADKGNGMMEWSFPSYKETVTGKPDGSDLPIVGPQAAPGLTVSYKSSGVPRQRAFQVKLNGKALEHGLETVSPDGKLLTVTTWREGKSGEQTTAIYTRQ